MKSIQVMDAPSSQTPIATIPKSNHPFPPTRRKMRISHMNNFALDDLQVGHIRMPAMSGEDVIRVPRRPCRVASIGLYEVAQWKKKMRDAFFEHVKSGALAEAEEVATTLLEFMFLQRNFGQGVSDTLVAQFRDNNILRAPPAAGN